MIYTLISSMVSRIPCIHYLIKWKEGIGKVVKSQVKKESKHAHASML